MYVEYTQVLYTEHATTGLMESIATCNVLESVIEGKRCVVISRSTFPGSGSYVGHWGGTLNTHTKLLTDVIFC